MINNTTLVSVEELEPGCLYSFLKRNKKEYGHYSFTILDKKGMLIGTIDEEAIFMFLFLEPLEDKKLDYFYHKKIKVLYKGQIGYHYFAKQLLNSKRFILRT